MAKLLLDTHIFLWAFLEKDKLSRKVIDELLENTEVEKYLSAASSWEIAVKHAKGRLFLPEPPKVFVPTRMTNAGIEQLAVSHRDTLNVGELPDIHKDPFDRLLITQARLNDLTILTDDRLFEDYDVQLIRADKF
jgi:PIN domain nuclease of toxin-antitoxin system